MMDYYIVKTCFESIKEKMRYMEKCDTPIFKPRHKKLKGYQKKG